MDVELTQYVRDPLQSFIFKLTDVLDARKLGEYVIFFGDNKRLQVIQDFLRYVSDKDIKSEENMKQLFHNSAWASRDLRFVPEWMLWQQLDFVTDTKDVITIAKYIFDKTTESDRHISKKGIEQTYQAFVHNGVEGNYKACRTRAKNLWTKGLKLSSLKYFPTWLAENS